MRDHGRHCSCRAAQRLWPLALAAASLGLPGCLHFVNPIDAPSPPVVQQARELPQVSRDHVYVFFVNGVDPLSLGNLRGLRGYVAGLGFTKTYYGEAFHALWFAQEVRRIRATDPDGRVALVAFSLGNNVARGFLRAVEDEGIGVDLLLSLSSNNLIDFSHERPANVGRLVDVQVHGRDLGPSSDPSIQRYNLHGPLWHFAAPSQRRTCILLTQELLALAATVPVADRPLPANPFVPEELARPHTARSAPPASAEGWELLTPLARLPDVTSVGLSEKSPTTVGAIRPRATGTRP